MTQVRDALHFSFQCLPFIGMGMLEVGQASLVKKKKAFYFAAFQTSSLVTCEFTSFVSFEYKIGLFRKAKMENALIIAVTHHPILYNSSKRI